MYRTHTCGELRLTDINAAVSLAGWVQTVRKFGSITPPWFVSHEPKCCNKKT